MFNLNRLSLALLLLIASDVWAMKGSISVRQGEGGKDLIIKVKNEAERCGILVRFGDGNEVKGRIEMGEEWSSSHTYSGDGNFVVEVGGALVMRGLRSASPCEFNGSAFVGKAAGAVKLLPIEGPLKVELLFPEDPAESDLIVLADKNAANVQIFNTIEGSKRLKNRNLLVTNGASACVVSEKGAYEGLSYEVLAKLASLEISEYFSKIGGPNNTSINLVGCIGESALDFKIAARSDLLLIQRKLLPFVINSSQGFGENYSRLFEIGKPAIYAQNNRLRDIEFALSKRIAARNEEFHQLARAGSHDKIGSVSFGSLKAASEMKFCTLAYEGDSAASVWGYAARGYSSLAEEVRPSLEKRNLKFDMNKPISKTFSNPDALYEAIQANPDSCNIYVDFPQNLRKIVDAVRRDKLVDVVVNQMVTASALRDEWAQKAGFQNYSEYLTVRNKRLNAK